MAFTWYSKDIMVARMTYHYLTRLNHTGKLSLKLVKRIVDVLLLDTSTAVINKNCTEPQLIRMESS